MRKLLTTTLAMAFAAPAFAGNVDAVIVEAAPVVAAPAPVYSWTGGYAGIQAGFADVRPGGSLADDAEDDDDDDDDDSILDGLDDLVDGEGGFFGGRLGYDRQFGRALVGGLVSYDGAGLELGDDTGLEIDSITRVGMRAGLTAGRNLFYATGGYANADTNEIGSADGYFAGAGYEALLTPRVSLGLEALYHDFDDFDDVGDVEDIDAKATTVGVNLNFRF